MKKTISLFLTAVLAFCLAAPVIAFGDDNFKILAPSGPSSGTLVGGPLDNVDIYSESGYNNSQSIGGILINTPTPEDLYAAFSSPVITKDPLSEANVEEECIFTSFADNYDSVAWYAIDPVTLESHRASEIGNYVKGVLCIGTDSTRLIIRGICPELSGWMFRAEFTNAYGTVASAPAAISSVIATPQPTPAPTPTPTPVPTPTPTPAPTPTPVMPASGNASSGGSTTNGSGVMGSDSKPVMPVSGSVTSGGASMGNTSTGTYASLTGSQGSGIEAFVSGASSKAYMGAYILAAVAGLVIIAAVIIMALYMKGKISLGKFEQVIGGDDPDAVLKDGDEFYDPNDFKQL